MATPSITPPSIEPLYQQDDPSGPIDLGEINVQFEGASKLPKGCARASRQFWPTDRLCLMMPVDPRSALRCFHSHLTSGRDGKIKLTDRDLSLEGFSMERFTKTDLVVSSTGGPFDVRPPSKGIVHAIFHVFNFPEFRGAPGRTPKSAHGRNAQRTERDRVKLCADGWNVTIARTSPTKESCAALKSKGGFIITHVARVERDAGAEFCSEQLSEFLECVRTFLSFALGRWAGAALPIGFDRAGKRVFEQWGMPIVSPGPWVGSESWLDCDHADALMTAFPGFYALWKSPLWHDPLWKALYWYLGANVRGAGLGVDAGLILAQAALEQLAWTYCVRDLRVVSEKKFDDKTFKAADRVRLLLSTLLIPPDLPQQLRALHGKNWIDGPQALTAVRNSLVHIREKDDLPPGAEAEACRLSLWFLDLVLLKLCKYDGNYANRMKILRPYRGGHVDRVL